MPSSCAPSTRRILTFEPVASSALSKRTSSLLESFARARLEVERRDARARQDLDALLGVPLGRPEHDVLARLLAAHVGLRERRPVVRRVGLAAHHQDVARRPPARAGGGHSSRPRCPPPTSRNSTSRSAIVEEAVDLRRDHLAPVFLEEVRRRPRSRAARRRRGSGRRTAGRPWG